MRPSLSLEEVPTSPSLTHVTHEGQRNSSLRDCPQAASSAHSASRSEPQHSASKRSPTLGSVGTACEDNRARREEGCEALYPHSQPSSTVGNPAASSPPWDSPPVFELAKSVPVPSHAPVQSQPPSQKGLFCCGMIGSPRGGFVIFADPGRGIGGQNGNSRRFPFRMACDGGHQPHRAPCLRSWELGRPTLPPCNESLTPLRKDGSGCASC
jgi:hypothetical protein